MIRVVLIFLLIKFDILEHNYNCSNMYKFSVSTAVNFSGYQTLQKTAIYCVRKPPVATHGKRKNGTSTCIFML